MAKSIKKQFTIKPKFYVGQEVYQFVGGLISKDVIKEINAETKIVTSINDDKTLLVTTKCNYLTERCCHWQTERSLFNSPEECAQAQVDKYYRLEEQMKCQKR